MINYKYDVVYSKKFKKSLKKLKKNQKDLNEMFDVIDKLAIKEELKPKYRNHKLIDDKNYKSCNECHIRPLIYQYNDNKLFLLLVNTGSHSSLFNK